MGRILKIAATVAALATTTLAPGALAGERCNEPYAPTIKLAPTASKADLSTLRADAEAFIAASDLYQKCMAAKGAAPEQVQANQLLKQKIGVQFNSVLHAFQAAHPGA